MSRITIPPEILARLGKEPDAVIARELRCSRGAVFVWRKRLGVASHIISGRRKTLTPEIIAKLGSLSDRKIAHQLGWCENTVAAWRRKLGLPASQPPTEYFDPPTPEIIARLGKKSDRAIAEEVGSCHHTVARWRKSLHIPSYRSMNPEEVTRFRLQQRRLVGVDRLSTGLAQLKRFAETINHEKEN